MAIKDIEQYEVYVADFAAGEPCIIPETLIKRLSLMRREPFDGLDFGGRYPNIALEDKLWLLENKKLEKHIKIFREARDALRNYPGLDIMVCVDSVEKTVSVQFNKVIDDRNHAFLLIGLSGEELEITEFSVNLQPQAKMGYKLLNLEIKYQWVGAEDGYSAPFMEMTARDGTTCDYVTLELKPEFKVAELVARSPAILAQAFREAVSCKSDFDRNVSGDEKDCFERLLRTTAMDNIGFFASINQLAQRIRAIVAGKYLG